MTVTGLASYNTRADVLGPGAPFCPGLWWKRLLKFSGKPSPGSPHMPYRKERKKEGKEGVWALSVRCQTQISEEKPLYSKLKPNFTADKYGNWFDFTWFGNTRWHWRQFCWLALFLGELSRNPVQSLITDITLREVVSLLWAFKRLENDSLCASKHKSWYLALPPLTRVASGSNNDEASHPVHDNAHGRWVVKYREGGWGLSYSTRFSEYCRPLLRQ